MCKARERSPMLGKIPAQSTLGKNASKVLKEQQSSIEKEKYPQGVLCAKQKKEALRGYYVQSERKEALRGIRCEARKISPKGV